MSFLLFERTVKNGPAILRPTGREFQLGGYQLVFRAWERRGRPVDQGWEVGADELIKLHTEGTESYDTRRLIVDFHPSASWRIGIIELLDIYAYTYAGDQPGSVSWTPLMLRMRDVLYEERLVTQEYKARAIAEIPEPTGSDDFVEFLYLNGDKARWGWGRNGSTNAVFLQGGARAYFRQFF